MLFHQAILVLTVALFGVVLAQYNQQEYVTPVPILKQINRHNDDGSYSYGYEGADGTFRIETKHSTGEVFGKYGFVDDVGKQRVVEYGASQRGFEPAGTGITVAPPTIHVGSDNNLDYDDGQYREDPRIYYKEESNSRSSNSGTYSGTSRFNTGFASQNRPQPQQYSNTQYSAPQQSQQYSNTQYSAPRQSQQYSNTQYSAPRQSQQHSNNRYYQSQDENYSSQPRAPITVDPNQFRGHPAHHFDVNSGSYSVNYSG